MKPFYVDLGHNQFCRNIFHSKFYKTKILLVDENHLKGSIPHEIGMLGSLEKFYAHNNNISGSFPSSIGNLGSLTVLSLGNNIFS